MDQWSKHFRRLRKLLLRRGSTRDDAEDLIQEAFLKMQEYCRRGGQVQKPENFLARTVLRLAINARRDEHRDLYVKETSEELTLLIDPNPTPDKVLAGDECLKRMRDTLDGVSHQTRDILFMQRLDGLSYAEISKRTGLGISAIEKRIASALAILSEVNDLE